VKSSRRPSRKVLCVLLTKHTVTEVARMYRMLPTSVRRWAKYYGIPPKSQGERHHNARLSEDDVRLVRALYAEGLRQVDIAEKFGIGQTTVSNVLNFVTWRHVL